MYMLNFLCNQLGACLHWSLANNSAGDNPRDGMSAGLLLPEQWSKQCRGTSFLIYVSVQRVSIPFLCL